jgi:hypothetical protein
MKQERMSERDQRECAAHFARMALPVGGWQCAGTFTFSPSSPARTEWVAAKRFRTFMNEQDRRHVSWLAGVEPNPDHHRLNPGHHLHALFADVLVIHRVNQLCKRWEKQWGNVKVRPVRSTEGARNYLLKYCVKEGCMIDWQEAGQLWCYRHQDKTKQIFDPPPPSGVEQIAGSTLLFPPQALPRPARG